MTDRHRQIGASTAAPAIAEPCTECRGFANVPQMLRGRWARGACHACGGAGTRAAQAGRKLPLWDARGWVDTPYPEPTTPAGAVETVRVSDPLPSMADYGRHLDAIAEVKLGIDAWGSRRALWADVNEPPKPESPALLEQVREAMPRGDWGSRMDPRTAEDAKALVSPVPPFVCEPVRQVFRCTVDSIVIE